YASATLIDASDRVGRGRHRDRYTIGALQDPVHHLRTAEDGRVVLDAAEVATDRADVHVECVSAVSDRPADPSIAQNSYRSAGRLRPDRRRLAADCPLAPPLPHPECGVKPGKLTGQGQHCADYVFCDTRLVTIDIRQRYAMRQRRPNDAVEPRSGNLDEF